MSRCLEAAPLVYFRLLIGIDRQSYGTITRRGEEGPDYGRLIVSLGL